MSKIQLDPYLFFTGNCREAMEFYKEVFGGELTVQTYGEMTGESSPEGAKELVMHAYLTGGHVQLMASDGTRTEPYPAGPISLSLSGTDEEVLRKLFADLCEGGKVTAELKKEVWGAIFGGVTDKFGIDWMVNINQENA